VGEEPVLPSVTAEDQPATLAAAGQACDALAGAPAVPLGAMLQEITVVLLRRRRQPRSHPHHPRTRFFLPLAAAAVVTGSPLPMLFSPGSPDFF